MLINSDDPINTISIEDLDFGDVFIQTDNTSAFFIKTSIDCENKTYICIDLRI